MSMPAESKPIPDPTKLTTEALTREIRAVRELLFNEIAHRGKLTDVQFEAVRSELYAKLDAISQRFGAIERRTAEQKADTRLALDAALASAKDAVRLQTEASQLAQAKSETAFTKQIDGILLRIDQTVTVMDGQIGDLKARLDRLEGKSSGISSSRGILVGFIGIVGVALAIYANTR